MKKFDNFLLWNSIPDLHLTKLIGKLMIFTEEKFVDLKRLEIYDIHVSILN